MTKIIYSLVILTSSICFGEKLDINVCYRVYGQKDCVRIYQNKKKFLYELKSKANGTRKQRRTISSLQAQHLKFTIRRVSHATYGRSAGRCKELVTWTEKKHETVNVCVSNQSRSKKMRLRRLISQIID